eukprot:gene11646-13756_t
MATGIRNSITADYASDVLNIRNAIFVAGNDGHQIRGGRLVGHIMVFDTKLAMNGMRKLCNNYDHTRGMRPELARRRIFWYPMDMNW